MPGRPAAAAELSRLNSKLERMNERKETPGQAHGDGCCADVFGQSANQSTLGETQEAFGALMRAVQAPGALDEKAKELILFALVLQSRCAPCFDAHYAKAIELGISRAQLDEAAWCAIAMGGAPVRMFYQESLRRFENKTLEK